MLNSGRYNKIKRQNGVIVKKEVTDKPGKKGKEKNAKVYLSPPNPNLYLYLIFLFIERIRSMRSNSLYMVIIQLLDKLLSDEFF